MVHSVIYKTMDMNEIIKKIDELIGYKDFINKSSLLKNKITEELLFLGYDISHKGTQYLIKTIEYIASNSYNDLGNLEKEIYPKIAIMYNDSVHNIKCRINRATSTMYCNCEIKKLKKYFHFDVDTRPKVKTIINTIINKISLE